ncbi:unnamed protein product [Cunninghamella echinulata]
MKEKIKNILETVGLKHPSINKIGSSTTTTTTTTPIRFEPFNENIAEIYRYRQHIGVNLGSLFILESWLCPPPLKNSSKGNWSSELDFLILCEKEKKSAKEILQHHWQTFITTKDIDFLEQQGINAIRLPIGYWLIHPDRLLPKHDAFYPYRFIYQHTWDHYVLPLIQYCEQKKIGVLIDLHGLPGGQNNDDHCGIRASSTSSFFNASKYQDLYFLIFDDMMKQLIHINNIIGIELVNEPINHPKLLGFYQRACKHMLTLYKQQHTSTKTYLPIYLADGWKPGDFINHLYPQLHYPFIVLDTHQYFCHAPSDHEKTAQQHQDHVQHKLSNFLSLQGKKINHNIVIGEWSMVLNGKSMKGAMTNERQTMMTFGQCQAKVWSNIGGHFYWTYRTGDDKWYWSLKYCIRENLVPWLNNYKEENQKRKKHSSSSLDQLKEKQLMAYQHDYLPSHLKYWKQQQQQHTKDNKSYQQIEKNSGLYEQGFKDGLNVAIRFYHYETTYKIGFTTQLVLDYRSRLSKSSSLDQHYLWQYDHGFLLAIEKVEAALN